jgi:hypothetical protein
VNTLSPRIPLLALAAIALLALPATAAARSAQPKSETASAPGITAQLDWVKHSTYDYGHTRLTIVRDGVTALDHAKVPAACIGGPCAQDDTAQPLGAVAGSPSLTIRDLDGDGEPEVIVDLYTGGAHCCAYSRVYRWDAATGTYTDALEMWGDPAYRLEDLDGDGTPEFVTADDRFAYAFTDYAASGLPIRILRYSGGTFTDVTRAYPALIAADARHYLAAYHRARRASGPKDLKGIAAAYVADQYLLGNPAAGRAFLASAKARGDLGGLGGSATKFVDRLGRFLSAAGYTG